MIWENRLKNWGARAAEPPKKKEWEEAGYNPHKEKEEAEEKAKEEVKKAE